MAVFAPMQRASVRKGDRGESLVPLQDSPRESEVPKPVLDPSPTHTVPALLLELVDLAEPALGRVAGLVERDPCRQVLLDQMVHVEPHLFGHLGLKPPPVNQRGGATYQLLHPIHGTLRRGHDLGYGHYQAIPGFSLRLQLLPAGLGQAVEFSPAIVLHWPHSDVIQPFSCMR